MKTKTYLQKFTDYAPELGEAISHMDSEFRRDLKSEEPSSSAFAVCDAFTVFWWAWHGGQSSRLYSLGSRFETEFEFRPAHPLSEETLEDDARELLAHIEIAFGVEARA